ncbi:MAG TPA: RsmG family class I SAM-dependent methyltransferase [Acidobacteriota bacterium]|nr:RsmG family class I SAM-dependent methyltransferase [Acidobacteriota bacterium]
MLPTHWKDSKLLTPQSSIQLSKFRDLILLWNQKINLTGYRTREEIDDLLIGESVVAAQALEEAGVLSSATRVLDFGSGAGIPGLVWSILGLPADVVSLEIRQKKIAFQKEVARDLALKARIMAGRFPEAVANESFDLIVSRAIRYDPAVWEEGKALLKPDGRFVRFASADAHARGWTTLPVSPRTSILMKGPAD